IVPATGGPHVEGPGVAPVLHAGRVRLARQVLPRPVVVQHDPVLARGLCGVGVLGPPQRGAGDQLHAASTPSASPSSSSSSGSGWPPSSPGSGTWGTSISSKPGSSSLSGSIRIPPFTCSGEYSAHSPKG